MTMTRVSRSHVASFVRGPIVWRVEFGVGSNADSSFLALINSLLFLIANVVG